MTDPSEAARQDMDAVAQAYAPNVEYWINVTGESLGLDALLEMVRRSVPVPELCLGL